MSINKTKNYQLTLWDYADEDFTAGRVREDLAANFTAIDTAIKAEEAARVKATPRVVVGAFTGSAPYTNTTLIQAVKLGFRPKAVYTTPQEGGGEYGGLILDGHPARLASGEWMGRVTDTGFEVKNVAHYYFNYDAKTFYYMAIG